MMITGDNPLTATNIAYQSQILSEEKKVMILDFQGGRVVEEEFHEDFLDQKFNNSAPKTYT